MKFYDIALAIVRFVFYVFNGKPQYTGLENLPAEDEAVIFASTHRSMTDPLFLAFPIYPRKIAFMGKDSLFRNKILGPILPHLHVFPVNREKTSPKTIRHAVKVMNEDRLNLGIFPSGTRYSTEIKGGTAFIQRLSKNSIVPVAIQPPIGFWQFILRKKAKVAFGKPIPYDPDMTYDKAKLAEIDQAIGDHFDLLDQQMTTGYTYIPPQKK